MNVVVWRKVVGRCKRSSVPSHHAATIAHTQQHAVISSPPLCSVPELYEHALKYEPSTHIVGHGALATLSGAKTGRSPK